LSSPHPLRLRFVRDSNIFQQAQNFDYHLRKVESIPKNLVALFNKLLSSRVLVSVANTRPLWQCGYCIPRLGPFYFCLASDLLDLYERCRTIPSSDVLCTKHQFALHWACRSGSVVLVQRLLKLGCADYVNTLDIYGASPLKYASSLGAIEVIRALLECITDVNRHGGQALQSAAEAGLETALLRLLEKGADVNAQGGEHGNALQAASHKGNAIVVRMLLENGAVGEIALSDDSASSGSSGY
jgi:hypothetical protein